MQRDTARETRILQMMQHKVPLTVYETVTSTNDLVREAAEQGAPAGTVIAAMQQTAGRGRQGRAFYSPEHTGLYLSMLLRPDEEAVRRLTPMAAAAAARAVETVSGEKTEIKWVNDLLLHGKKICGILAEAKFSEEAVPDYAVLGIGINLLAPQGGFPAEIRDIAGAVFPQGTDADAAFDRCAAALTDALLDEYAGIRERHYLAGYKARLCVIGKAITVCENGTERPARALAADDDLRLLVRYEDDGSEQWRATGEIRIRLK